MAQIIAQEVISAKGASEMSIQDFATLFLLTFVAFILLCIVQGLKSKRHEPPDFYQGCYESLLNEVGKKKDNR